MSLSLLFHQASIITLDKPTNTELNSTRHSLLDNNKCQDWRLVVDDCRGYKPDEIHVKMGQNNGYHFIILECYHGNKQDYFGFPTRVTSKCYVLPCNVEPSQVRCNLSKDCGSLTFSTCNINNIQELIPINIECVEGSSTFVIR